MRYNSQKLVAEYLKRFPNSPKQAVARVLFKENPEVFSSVERARDVVRYYTGARGAQKRKSLDPEHINIKSAMRVFPALPNGFRDIDDFAPFIIDPGTTLILNDLHFPWYSREGIEAAVREAKKRKIDTVLLNGDIADCYAQSRWETNPKKRDAKKELQLLSVFLTWLRHQFPKARFIWKYGNHEERHESYLIVRAPELLRLPGTDLHDLVRLVEGGVEAPKHWGLEIVKDMRPIKAGKLYIIHGHEYKFAIQNPVNPARGLYLRAKKPALCGHFHQESSHTESDISEDVTSCWSVACLCDLHPRYMPLNKWCHGFAIVQHTAQGAFHVENRRVVNGSVL